ncbi:zinc finger protein 271-like [Diorhabda sublineata]|uniref:zinc finger protein 271-like n=1 Tax=Diorhabda sublineata TaxID=1163346 RepID=UPI0024E0ED4C|nr:zinc finger protein 271-like [Diorhabda sublineata]
MEKDENVMLTSGIPTEFPNNSSPQPVRLDSHRIELEKDVTCKVDELSANLEFNSFENSLDLPSFSGTGKSINHINMAEDETSDIFIKDEFNADEVDFPGKCVCNVCGMIFDDVNDLARHKLIHVPNETKLENVEYNSFEDSSDSQSVDGAGQSIEQMTENKTTDIFIKDELSAYAANFLEKYICSVCDWIFDNESDLDRHNLIHGHYGKKRKKDSTCNLDKLLAEVEFDGFEVLFDMPSVSRTENSIQKITEDIFINDEFNAADVNFPETYVCNVCDMKFSNVSDLDHHNLIHDPYGLKYENNVTWKVDKLPLRMKYDTSDLLSFSGAGQSIQKITEVINATEDDFSGKYIMCKACNAILDNASDLYRHDLIHDPDRQTWKLEELHTKVKFDDSSDLPSFSRAGQSIQTINANKDPTTTNTLKNEEFKADEVNFPEKYVCNVCNVIFDKSSDLDPHSLIHDHYEKKSEKNVACNLDKLLGKVEFDDSSDLPSFSGAGQSIQTINVSDDDSSEISINEEASCPKKYICNVCNMIFDIPSDLARHKLIHDIDYIYLCATCNRKFADGTSLRNHQKNYCKNGSSISNFCGSNFTVWKCKSCYRVFASKHIANHHLKLCVNVEITNEDPLAVKTNIEKILTNLVIQCEFCNRSYVDTKSLMMHQTKHTTIKNYECIECFLIFDCYSDATKHWMEKCTEHVNSFLVPKVIYCEHCDRVFGSHQLLYEHKRKTKHYTSKLFEPEIDIDQIMMRDDFIIESAVLNSIKLLDEALSRIDYGEAGEVKEHFDERNAENCRYQCENCVEMFSHANGLDEHRRKGHSSNLNPVANDERKQ